ncbi:MAG: PepSY domain-containing protein [Gemmatimonadota bacterium]
MHRWLGLSLSVLSLAWFLSGFVMMYSGFPAVGWEDRINRGEPLSVGSGPLLEPGTAARTAGIRASADSVHLRTTLGRPVWVFRLSDGGRRAVYADDGSMFRVDARSLATRIAGAYEGLPDAAAEVATVARLDQWTPRDFYLPYMPLHRVHLDDGRGTQVYISSVTGDVVQRHDRQERLWGWLGPVVHWIYPRDLIVRRPIWRQVVIWTSGLGVLMCLAGLTIGAVRFLQVRRLPHSASRITPYRDRWFRWHHYLGFVFGIVTLTWVFSGLLSMSPFQWTPSTGLSIEETLRWQGGALDLDAFEVSAEAALGATEREAGRAVRLLKAVQIGGQPFWVAHLDWAETLVVPAGAPHGGGAESSQVPVWPAFPEELILAGAARILPEAPRSSVTWITEPDAYYYPRYQPLRFPALRVRFDDRARTWLYLDPATGEVAYRYEKLSRLNRWIYHGLHSFDFPGLNGNRPLWDIVVLVLMAGGTALSATGTILTWRWLSRNMRR